MGIGTDVAKRLYRLLSDRFESPGKFYFEMWIRTYDSGKTWCDMGIYFPEPDFGKQRDLLVGIEVKNWSDPVTPSVIKAAFAGYRYQFDLFYLAAPTFGPSVEELFDVGNDEWDHRRHCGLIRMGAPYEIVEHPSIQPTYSGNRRKFIKRIYTNWSENESTLESYYPDIMREVEGQPDDPGVPPPGQLALEEFES